MEIVLQKRTTIITTNVGEFDYFTLDPFDFNGNVGINQMSVIIDLQEEWNGFPFIFNVPQIAQLPTLNFQADFTNFYNAGSTYPMVRAGNDFDYWDNGFILNDGVMTWLPQSIEPLAPTTGWWLVEQPNTTLPALGLARAVDGASQNFGGPEAFKELMAKFK